jgi:hypothetical protein
MNEPTVPMSLAPVSYFERLHELFDRVVELPDGDARSSSRALRRRRRNWSTICARCSATRTGATLRSTAPR